MHALSHSFADPTPYIPAAHEAGIKVLAQVQKVSHAKTVALAGVDAIAAQGSEAGGHTGHSGTLPRAAIASMRLFVQEVMTSV